MSSYGASATAATIVSFASSTAASVMSSSSMAKGNGARVSAKHTPAYIEHVWYGLLGLLGLATIINVSFLTWATYRRYKSRSGRTSAPSHSSLSSRRLALRRIPHAILAGSRIVSFRWRIPHIDMTLLELVLTLVYLGGCLAWSFAPREIGLPRVNLQPANWAGNTAKLAAAQLPLAVVLALKNNPVTWLTGLGHEKASFESAARRRLVPMHRIVSRCIFVLTWIHMVGAYYRSPATFLNQGWKIAGLVGAVAQTITTIFGIKSIRRRYYEVFYSSHVVLILIFLITVHIHCIPVKCDLYVWPVWVLWGFDRLLRASRYLLFNVLMKPANPNARVERIGADGLRVTLRRRIPGGWKAGQHVFLAFPRLGIESHPFTIGNVYEKVEGSDEAEMMFIIRAQGGQTRMLKDLAAPSGSCELKALFDGPYGHPEDIRPFSTCVFIAGGTGVTYTLARMHQLFKDVNASNACAKRVVFIWAVRTESEYGWIASELSKAVSVAPSSVSVSVEVFVTGGIPNYAIPVLERLKKEDRHFEKRLALSRVSSYDASSSPTKCGGDDERFDEKTDGSCMDSQPSSGTCTPTKSEGDCFGSGASTPTVVGSDDGASPLKRSRISRRPGRPDVRRILEEEVTASEGAVAVDVSGPDGLVNAVRSALCEPFSGPMATLRGAPTVLLSVEQFRM
ncbi:hypothetical protein OH77DRAFT_1458037 [Trametes cingulata]|nr:hypothetical protein OH77DRAFT_1458037 [Trametes cingulata]